MRLWDTTIPNGWGIVVPWGSDRGDSLSFVADDMAENFYPRGCAAG